MTHPLHPAAARLIAAGEMLYLSRADVSASGGLAWGGLIEAIAEAYRAQALGDVAMPKADYLRYAGRPSYDRIIALFGYLGGRFNLSGLKQICSATGNGARGLPRASGLLILNDPATNRPFALLEASAISAARTAAVSGLALRLFGPASLARIAIIGCGALAHAHLDMLAHMLSPATASLCAADPDGARCAQFRAAAETAGFTCDIAPTAEAAVREADMVLPMTTAEQPHIRRDWLKPGCFYCAVSLLDAELEIYRAASIIIVDDLGQCLNEGRPLHRLARAGALEREKIVEIGSWLAAPRDLPADERPRLFNPMGTVITDLAAGFLVFSAAAAAGRGVRLPL